MSDVDVQRIVQSTEFKELIAARRSLSRPIVATTIFTYFGFILLIAFKPSILAHHVGGTSISVGIYAGLALLALGFAMTALYMRGSERRITQLQAKIQKDMA